MATAGLTRNKEYEDNAGITGSRNHQEYIKEICDQ